MIPNYIQHIVEYYHEGMFTIDQKEMSFERRIAFKRAFTEDFYYLDELREQYLIKFSDADVEEINSYNLKQMGFVVNSKYVIQHYPSADEFIRAKLLEDDRFDMRVFRERFANLGFYNMVSLELRKSLEIIEYSTDQYINFRKLKSGGVTTSQFADFCNEVFEAAEENAYFSIHSLRRKGFDSELFELGFDDLFYASLLISDERFSWQKLMGTMVFYKGRKNITFKDFVSDAVKRERSIDLYDLDTMLRDEYGCDNIEKYDLTFKTRDADIFYDSELQRFYADQELYYREIDENGGL